jgi:hypothetical protein
MGNLIGYSAIKSTKTGGKSFLSTSLTSSGTIGSKILTLGTRGIALANNGNYTYLCAYVDNAASDANKSLLIAGKPYALATSGQSYCLFTSSLGNSTAINSIVLGYTTIAINSSGSLIIKDCTSAVGTPDEEDAVYIGDKPLRVVRKGSNWYLVIK